VSDVKSLLDLALDDPAAPAPGPRDPGADLARAHRGLRRRRLTRTAGGLAVAGALGLGAVTLVPGPHSPAAPTPSGPVAGAVRSTPPVRSPSGTATTAITVDLVAYHGAQVPGYAVASVPKGWVIQGADAYVLTIAPRGTRDTEYTSFVNKLVVMLESVDAAPSDEGLLVQVGGRPARFVVQEEEQRPASAPRGEGPVLGATQLLHFTDAHGHRVVIQAPVALGWDAQRLARFAEGVQVLRTAQAGRG